MVRSSIMAKRYAILQKKLEELESQIHRVISLPPDTPCHQLLAEAIHQRFLFFSNLLSAETLLHPTKPHHLRHISQRLAQLQTAFSAWDEFVTFSAPDQVDDGSPCSCTESCLNDDDDDDCSELGRLEGAGVEKAAPVSIQALSGKAERGVRREKGEKSLAGGGCCRVLMVGAALTSLLIMRFCSFDHRYEFFPTPT